MPLPPAGSFPTGTALRGLAAALLKELAGHAPSIGTDQGTASTSFTDLATAGPTVSVTSVYDRALIFWSAGMYNSSAASGCACSVAVSGATTIAAGDLGEHQAPGAIAQFGNLGCQFALATIIPGLNTYTMKYKASGNTAQFYARRLLVIAP